VIETRELLIASAAHYSCATEPHSGHQNW